VDGESLDPDVDLAVPAQRAETRTHPLLLPAIALGGVVGASLRHLLEVWWPPSAGQLPAATLITNLVGALVMGAVMVVVGRYGDRYPLLRPYVGVGVLGGFTTMSTFAVGTATLAGGGHVGVAIAYGVLTMAGAVAAAGLGWFLAGRVGETGPTAGTGADQGGVRRILGGAALAVVVPGIAMLVGVGPQAWWVVLGALVGAPTRYLVDRLVQNWHRTAWPWGTTVINLSGSLLLGILTGAGLPEVWMLALGVGFCGSYTTWSTAAFEVTTLWRHDRRRYAITYGLVVPIGCTALALGGLVLTRTVVGT